MTFNNLSNPEVTQALAERLRSWRVSPQGAGLSQAALAERSGVSLTSIKRFERTGGITLLNLVALMRALGLVANLEELVPDPDGPSPLEILEAEQKRPARQRAPRSDRGSRRGG